MNPTLAVFTGGCAGALARYGLLQAIGHPTWPWATFVANVAGAALLGWIATRDPDGWRRSLIGTGFCGALTTFSTLQLELFGMLDDGRLALALAYAAASLAVGYIAVSAAVRWSGPA